MGTKRILVVDDERDTAQMIQDALCGAGYDVDCAGDAAQSLELVRQKIYDAAIVDFNLPDMNGMMLHRQIRQMDEELGTRTLFTSGLAQSDKNLDYYSAYGKGFLSKPFEIEELLRALDSFWTEGDSGP